MIEAWGRGFEKIKEACGLYDDPLPEYEINESGIMVLCKACDKYLKLLKNDAQYHGFSNLSKFFWNFPLFCDWHRNQSERNDIVFIIQEICE